MVGTRACVFFEADDTCSFVDFSRASLFNGDAPGAWRFAADSDGSDDETRLGDEGLVTAF